MISPEVRCAHRELDAKIRAFVARRIASPADVDDIVQSVFLRMQQGLPGLRAEDRYGPWVYQIARSAIAEHLRQRARHPLAGSESEADEQPQEVEQERAVEQMLASHVAPFIALLPSPYREALTLSELEGIPHRRAAEMAGVSLPAMKSRVLRGRAMLRDLLDACCEISLDARKRIVACEPRSSQAGAPPCACGPRSRLPTIPAARSPPGALPWGVSFLHTVYLTVVVSSSR